MKTRLLQNDGVGILQDFQDFQDFQESREWYAEFWKIHFPEIVDSRILQDFQDFQDFQESKCSI